MTNAAWLEDVIKQYRYYKGLCDRAAAQVRDGDFFRTLGENGNSLATLMKHLGGNHRSRWRDFLTTDGEKRDRNRDSEFVSEGDTRASIQELWEEGWRITFETLSSLTPEDVDRSITIRGQSLTVYQAILRNLAHAAYHSGQIVEQARAHAGSAWQTLTIAVGESDAFNEKMKATYGDFFQREGERHGTR